MANNDRFRLVKIEANFTSFRTSVAYEAQNIVERMKQFAYDVPEGILMIIYMIQSEHSKNRYMKIIDINTSEILWNSSITDHDLIGRLKCGIFSIASGYIYHSNCATKIRYDLLRRDKHN